MARTALIMTAPDTDPPWYLYILRCKNNSLYTGITLDVDRRIAEHAGELGVNKGAKALRGKSPLELVYKKSLSGKSEALKLEYKVKKLAKREKEALVSGSFCISTLAS